MNSIKVGKFPQRTRTFYGEKEGLRDVKILAICEADGILYVGCESGLLYLKDGEFKSIKLSENSSVKMLYNMNGIMYVGSGDTVYTVKNGKVTGEQKLDSEVLSADSDAEGTFWLLTEKLFYKFTDGEFVKYSGAAEGSAFTMTAFANGQVYLAGDSFLYGLHGKRPRWTKIDSDNSNMPEGEIRDIAADDWCHIWIATENGIVLYDAKNNWYTHEKIQALIEGDIRKIVIAKDGTRYIGTDCGLFIQNGATQSFLGAERWLPAGEVTAIYVSDDGTIYVGTPKGISKIEYKMMSLEEKANIYEDIIEKYHRREGLVATRNLSEKDDITSGTPAITDNDGLWTGFYLGGEALRYAVTGEEEALLRARRAKDAILKLIYITEVPGFPARAYRRPGDDRYGNGNIEWHLVKDELGDVEWKGETSSDETTGHFFGLSYYYDLCADEAEKKEISDAVCSVMDHIIRNGYTLCDIDGLPTTWSHWGPQELNHDDIWFWEKGINSYELLCMLKTAFHMSGDEKYQKIYEDLIKEHHYGINCMQIKVDDCYDNHIDDNLGFITYANLLRYEENPQIRQYLLAGMKHHWDYERIERCPMWNFVYAAMSNNLCCDIEEGVQSLREMPLDLICYKVINSGRKDLVFNENAIGDKPQLAEPLPFDERPILGGYDKNPFLCDGGYGMRAQEPTIYLVPYWYARYYGIIEETEA